MKKHYIVEQQTENKEQGGWDKEVLFLDWLDVSTAQEMFLALRRKLKLSKKTSVTENFGSFRIRDGNRHFTVDQYNE